MKLFAVALGDLNVRGLGSQFIRDGVAVSGGTVCPNNLVVFGLRNVFFSM